MRKALLKNELGGNGSFEKHVSKILLTHLIHIL